MPYLYKDDCPKCDGLKDKRAKMCSDCRFIYNHPRKGTGIEKRLSTNGYVNIMIDSKEVYEHRHIMENFLGRKLKRREHIHHIDHNKANNDILNLELIECRDHHKLHFEPRKYEMSRLGHEGKRRKRYAASIQL